MATTSRLPTGTVTLLFTDIEGSTERWERRRDAMSDALERHDNLVRSAIESHGGYIFKMFGDAVCAAFWQASNAVAAAAEAQRALALEDWSAVGGLRVRMALHSGATHERDGDYFGPTVNRVARLLTIAHGEQVVVSGVTEQLLRGLMPQDTALRDLGEHFLKDIDEPEHVWQLAAPGLAESFPPLRSHALLPNNLPPQLTSFIGREREVVEVRDLLGEYRLVTLVGSGGVGKTRLAVRVGTEVLDRYPDGVWFVDFAPIADRELVSSLIAQVLGMSQQRGARVDEALPLWLKTKKLLLIFDNCEHLVDTVAMIATAILSTASQVRILATSRQALEIGGEAIARLPSLDVPRAGANLGASDAMTFAAVALFVSRAALANRSFALTDDTAPIIADICRRLDGIPLAIELAAARATVLSIQHLAERLNERFDLLTGGNRDALPRQKTLRALIDWSYDLLTLQEQILFARLGIFAGGFGLDAAANVCGGNSIDDIDFFDLLTSLTGKSLVAADTSSKRERYRLLESTAAYAIEKVRASGQSESLAQRHAQYFRLQAEAADERFGTISTLVWLADVEMELGNYRSALTWALTDRNDAVSGAAIAGALQGLWVHGGLAVEGQYWIEQALAAVSESEHPRVAARLQLALSNLVPGKRSHDFATRAMRLYASLNDMRGVARAQSKLVFALLQLGAYDAAYEANAQSLAAARTCGDAWHVANGLLFKATIKRIQGDVAAARDGFAQALRAYNASDEMGSAVALNNLAELEFANGDPVRALRSISEALEINLRGKNASSIATNHTNAAAYRIALDDLAGAREDAREGLRVARNGRVELSIAIALQHLALVAGLGGDLMRCAQLLGYVDARYIQLGNKRQYTEQWGYDKLVSVLRKTLNEDEIRGLLEEGAGWSEDRAVHEARLV